MKLRENQRYLGAQAYSVGFDADLDGQDSSRDRDDRHGVENGGKRKKINVRKFRPWKFVALERMALPDSTQGL